jgi:hypothetical protein
MDQRYLSQYSYGLWFGWLVFDSWQDQEIFLNSTASRPVLEPTQPPIQWVLGALFPELKQPEQEADRSTFSCAQVKNGGDGGGIPPIFHASS